jgi:sugar lactone lactonase YvrE
VSSQRTGDVVGYRPAQFRRSGDPKPAVVLHMPGGSNSQPEAVAFDRRGHLWVALYGRNEVVRFSSEQLGRSGRPVPASRLRFEPADGSPIGLAADDEDRLWVVLDAAGVVEAFATSHPSGRPVARVEGAALSEPHAIASDSAGSGCVAFHDGRRGEISGSRRRGSIAVA